MTSAAKRAKLKDDHSSGLIGRSLTNLRPEGWPSKPCGDVTLALPHARWIILLTGRYKPKKRKEKRKNGGRVHCFNMKDEQKNGWRGDVEGTDLHTGLGRSLCMFEQTEPIWFSNKTRKPQTINAKMLGANIITSHKKERLILHWKKCRKLSGQKQNQLSHSCEFLQKNKYFY